MKIYHNLPDWSCPNKIRSRIDSIIEPYKGYFNTTKLPENKQYWSICGKCYNSKTNDILIGSEPEQAISSKLITPNQFHGVEINKTIYQGNLNIKNDCNWYNNDFYTQLAINDGENKLNPGIVNVDMLLMPENGAFYLSKVMNLLTRFNNLMLIGNFILKWRWRSVSANDIIIELQKHSQFQSAMSSGKWNFNDKVYFYKGSGKKMSYFGTILFFIE